MIILLYRMNLKLTRFVFYVFDIEHDWRRRAVSLLKLIVNISFRRIGLCEYLFGINKTVWRSTVHHQYSVAVAAGCRADTANVCF